MNRLLKVLGFILLLSLVLTCKKKDVTPPPTETVIAEKTNVIDDNTWKEQFKSMDTANYTLTFSKDIAKDLKAGDVIVSAAGEGLLRKITSVQTINNETKVLTEPAALTDVVQQGLIQYDQPLTMSQISSIDYNYPGMTLKKGDAKGTDQTQFGWDINVVLYDRDNNQTTTNDQIKLTGNLNCDWRLAFKIDIGFLSNLKEVKFGFTSSENLNLELIAGVEYQFEKKITLATINFAPITVFAGAVPVIFTPQLKINVGFDGSAAASVTTGITQSMTFDAGMQYLKDRGWAPYNTFTKDLQFNPPQLNMNASAGAYIKPEMLIKIYSVGGPYANLKLYSRLDADISQTPWWKLYGGITMSAGAKVSILNRWVLEYAINDLIKYEQVLAQATTPRVTVPVLTTAAASSITRTTATSGGNISGDGRADVTSRGVCWSTSENPTSDLQTKTSNGTGTGSFTSNLTGLTPATKYYIRAYATNSAGTAYGTQVSFTTDAPGKPVLTTAAATEITMTTAKSGGDITSDEGAQVTARGICWSTSENPTTDLTTKISGGTGTGAFTGNITGLTPATKYYVRAYATNSAGTSYGVQVSFTTDAPGKPVLTTASASAITMTTASSGGEITSDGGASVTSRGICWSTSENPTTDLTTKTSSGSGTGLFSGNLTGLTPGTTYYIRAYATNSAGTTYGQQVSFTTDSPVKPVLTTTQASDITMTSATSGGNITSDGGALVTARGVCWSTSENPTTDLTTKTFNSIGTGPFTSNITGLSPGTKYYVRAYATNSSGTSYGVQISFTTNSPVKPALTTAPASGITMTTASSGGEITSDGGASVTARGICWSTAENPTIDLTTKTTNGSGSGLFTSNLTGLTPGTTYYVRAYATNSAGTAYGPQVSFITDPPVKPALTTVAASEITMTTATSGGNITSEGGATVTARGICWSTSENPTTDLTTKTSDGSGPGSFTSNLTGLNPGTQYYIRAYATNSAGTSYGPQVSFTTEAPGKAVLTTAAASDITMTTAASGGNITSEGGATVTDRGICWSTTENPTTDLTTKTSNGTGPGSFTGNLSGLTPGTTYYIRAFATNSAGTSYGQQVSFTTDSPVKPALTTVAASGITMTTASSGGNITSDGGASVTARGVCWSTSENPTTDLVTKTLNGTGSGSFVSNLTGLTPGTTYYIRAYAINSAGTSYGQQVSFITNSPVKPTLTTSAASDITPGTAKSGGIITSDGGASVTARGVCWSTSENPTTDLSTKTSDGSGTGSFISSLTGLTGGTTYYVRAYATNSAGTSYGQQVSFTARETVTDIQGNIYNVVNIGTQTWMAENLRYLPSVSGSETGSKTEPYYYVYGYNGTDVAEAKATANYTTYGVLYNWTAAMNGAASSIANPSGVQGVCPTGWHLPSIAELSVLETYLGGTIVAGGKLKEVGTSHWITPNTEATNETGFTALPAGYRMPNSIFSAMGQWGYMWSTSETSTEIASGRQYSNTSGELYGYVYYKDWGFSVRCVKN